MSRVGTRLVRDELTSTSVCDERFHIRGGLFLVDVVLAPQYCDEVRFGARLCHALPQHSTAAVEFEVHGTVEVEDDEVIPRDLPRQSNLPELHLHPVRSQGRSPPQASRVIAESLT